jgi:hypothetical protein
MKKASWPDSSCRIGLKYSVVSCGYFAQPRFVRNAISINKFPETCLNPEYHVEIMSLFTSLHARSESSARYVMYDSPSIHPLQTKAGTTSLLKENPDSP